jgi:hypothetical protein
MDDTERFRLLRPYTTPSCRIGQIVRCAVLGEVRVVGYSDSPIPWPVTRRGKWRVPVVFRGLEQAVRRESAQAIAHWWGMGVGSVRQWRRALGVEASTEGTTRLRRDYFHEPWAVRARVKAHAKNQDPRRRAKLSASLRGRRKPRHVIEAVAAARRGVPLDDATRRKMSESHRARGTLVPGIRVWTDHEDELVRALPIAEVVRQTGRTVEAVISRRYRLRKTPRDSGLEGPTH